MKQILFVGIVGIVFGLTSCCKCTIYMPELIPLPYDWELVPEDEEIIFVEQSSK